MNVASHPRPGADSDDYLSYYPEKIRKNGWVCYLIWFLMVIGLLLTVILLPLSFTYVEYTELALKKNEMTNEVDLSTVYEHGRYNWGPSVDALIFPRGFQREELRLSIFPQNGLEFDIVVVFYWRVKPDKLKDLFEQFGQNYQSQIESRANAKIKNRAPDFSIEEYITKRPEITRELHKALRDELDLIYIEAPYNRFFLLEVDLPSSIRSRDLATAVREQRNLEEQNKQLVETVNKETERMEQEIQSNVTITALMASSLGKNIHLEAYAVGNRTVSDSDSAGSNNFFSELNVTNAVTKALYIRYFLFHDSLDNV